MRTRLVLLAALAVLLGPAATASAKEIAAVKACGADGCRDVTALATYAALDGGAPTTAPERGAPFFRLEVTVRAGEQRDTWTNLYVPAAQKLRADDGTWMNPASTTLNELDRLVRGVAPLPAAGLGLPTAAPAPAPAPAAPASGGGPPAVVWALIAAGLLGLLAAWPLVLRRRGAAAAG